MKKLFFILSLALLVGAGCSKNTSTVEVPKDWKEYEDKTAGFSFSYPENFKIKKEDPNDGSGDMVYYLYDNRDLRKYYFSVTDIEKNISYLKQEGYQEGDVGYVDWEKEMSDYQEKVVGQKIEKGCGLQEVSQISGYKYVEYIYCSYDPGGVLVNYELFTQKRHYYFEYILPSEVVPNTSEGIQKMIKDLLGNKFPNKQVENSFKEFETLVSSVDYIKI